MSLNYILALNFENKKIKINLEKNSISQKFLIEFVFEFDNNLLEPCLAYFVYFKA